MSDEERRSYPMVQQPPEPGSIVASALAGQLGSDNEYTDVGAVDMRRFTVLSPEEKPLILYAKLRSRKSRVWKTIYDEVLNLNVSVGGRGRRDIIRMEQVSHGGGVDVNAELEAIKPGWVQRNTTQRSWKKQALERGDV